MADSYRSPLLGRPGAAEIHDASLIDAAGVPWHYGAPLAEQRGLDSRTVFIDRSHRHIIAVSGPDAPVYLNNLLSQKLIDALPGLATSALDLDVQGHISHHLDISYVDGTFFLDVPAAQADSLFDYLTKMIFWSQVEVTRPDLALLTLLGEAVDLPSVTYSREVPWPCRRVDIAVPRTSLLGTVSALETAGCELAGLMAFTAERVRALEPELAADLDVKSIPHESAFLLGRAVHLDKGCYRGQETVSRVHNLGRAPRALVLLHLDGSVPELPTPGTAITAGGRAVGRLGTVVHDCDYGPIALGLVKRTALQQPGLAAGDCALAVDPDSLPDDSAERPGRAAINRLRGI